MVGRLVQQQQEWRLRSREHAGHAARSRSPPESVPAICSAARLRKANRARAAWASFAVSSGLRRRRLSRMLKAGSSRPTCWSSTATRSVRRLMSPREGSSSPVIRRNSVVLPEPLAPRTAIRSGPRTSNESGPNRWRSPKAITTSLKATSSRPSGRLVCGKSIASGVRISTRARAACSASVRSPIRRSARRLSRAALFSARSFSRSMNILSSMPLARQARPALSRRDFFSRAF